MPTDASPGRLRLLTVAVDTYDQDGDEDGDDGVNLGVKDQLRAVHAWWADPDLGGRGFGAEHPAVLECRNDIEAFLRSSGLREAPPDDVIVLYITGHGLKGTNGGHFLQLPATDTACLLATGYRTSVLVLAALDSHAAEVLVIVNTSPLWPRPPMLQRSTCSWRSADPAGWPPCSWTAGACRTSPRPTGTPSPRAGGHGIGISDCGPGPGRVTGFSICSMVFVLRHLVVRSVPSGCQR